MKNWLIKRLTPRKKQEERWTGLAEGLQQVWEEDFDPALARLEGLRSYFGADDADLALKLREMGDYFAADMPRPEDRPIAVAWRRLELEYKDLELILYSVFRRHYSDLPVSWFPLFAPVDEPYGMRFIPAEGPWPETKNIPPDGMFLTSRGLLGTDYGHLLSIGLSKHEFLEKALPLLRRTKPLHIVYDGALWYIHFDLPFACDLSVLFETEERFPLQFALHGARFDITPADWRTLDNGMVMTWESSSAIDLPFIPEHIPNVLWRLDMNLPEGFPEGWFHLDIVLPGLEGIRVAPLGVMLGTAEQSYPMPVPGFDLAFANGGTPVPHRFALPFDVQAEALLEGFQTHRIPCECLAVAQQTLSEHSHSLLVSPFFLSQSLKLSPLPPSPQVFPFDVGAGIRFEQAASKYPLAYEGVLGGLPAYMCFDDIPTDFIPTDFLGGFFHER